MPTYKRKSERAEDYLPISVYIYDEENERQVAGPFSGRIIDISRHGAGIMMTQVLLNKMHVFHSTRNQPELSLLLHIPTPPDNIVFTIPATAKRLEYFNLKNLAAFKLGVEFKIPPDSEKMHRLHKAIKQQQEERAKWWEQYKIKAALKN